MRNKIKGKFGEDAASDFLVSHGYEILERNYRFARSEIDLIALMGNELLVFIEVKMRSKSDFGEAESFVSEDQQTKVREAAEEYILGINWNGDIRFDIITVGANQEIGHFTDAFY